MPVRDEEIGAEIRRRGLEIEYLRELASALGFADEEGWTPEIFVAIEEAPIEKKRAAAIRTLRFGGDSVGGDAADTAT